MLASSGLITPPTILQNAPVGAINKRGQAHPINQPHRFFVDLDALYQRTDDLAPRVPVRLVQTVPNTLGKILQVPDHQA
jgi:hypothetical protein